MILAEHLENRKAFPAAELVKYEGQHIAWSLDGTRILAADGNPLTWVARLQQEGYGAAEYVLSFVDPDPSRGTSLLGQKTGHDARERMR
jgi:hypothetical protein